MPFSSCFLKCDHRKSNAVRSADYGVCSCTCVYACHDKRDREHVGARGQFMGVSSLLPCVLWGWNSSHQTWHQVPLATEPSSQPETDDWSMTVVFLFFSLARGNHLVARLIFQLLSGQKGRLLFGREKSQQGEHRRRTQLLGQLVGCSLVAVGKRKIRETPEKAGSTRKWSFRERNI